MKKIVMIIAMFVVLFVVVTLKAVPRCGSCYTFAVWVDRCDGDDCDYTIYKGPFACCRDDAAFGPTVCPKEETLNGFYEEWYFFYEYGLCTPINETSVCYSGGSCGNASQKDYMAFDCLIDPFLGSYTTSFIGTTCD